MEILAIQNKIMVNLVLAILDLQNPIPIYITGVIKGIFYWCISIQSEIVYCETENGETKLFKTRQQHVKYTGNQAFF